MSRVQVQWTRHGRRAAACVACLLLASRLPAAEPSARDEALHHYLLAAEALTQAQQASAAANQGVQLQQERLAALRQRLGEARLAVDAATRAAGQPAAPADAVTRLRQAENAVVDLAQREGGAVRQTALAEREAALRAAALAEARQALQQRQEAAQRLGAALPAVPAAAPAAAGAGEPAATPAVEAQGGTAPPLSHSVLCPFCRHQAPR
jgi:hypothetical protein